MTSVPWASLVDARAVWPDAVDIPDDVLSRYLLASWEKCVAYAPTNPDGTVEPVPQRYVEANVLAARDLFTAYQRTAGSDVIGFDTYAVRVRPLSAEVRSLLRPPSGVPRII